MSGLDDLLKGLAVFGDGMDRLGQSTAIKEANNQLAQINSQLSDEEALRAKTQLAGDLSQRLAGLNASGQQIQAATSFAPSPGAQFNAQLQERLQKQGQEFRSGQAALDRQNQRFISGLRTRQEIAKEERKEKKALAEKQVPDLEILPGFRPPKKAVEEVQQARTKTLGISSRIVELRNLFEEHGFEVSTKRGSAGAKMESLMTQIQADLKSPEFTNLGVLTGPDLEFLESMTGTTSSAFGAATEKLSLGLLPGAGTAAQKARIRQLGVFAATSFLAGIGSRGFKLKNDSQLQDMITEAGIPATTSKQAIEMSKKLPPQQASHLRQALALTLSADIKERNEAISILGELGIDIEGF